jgi:hypothetical protein
MRGFIGGKNLFLGQISDWRLEKDKDGESYYLTIETRRRNEKSMCPGWKRAPLK